MQTIINYLFFNALLLQGIFKWSVEAYEPSDKPFELCIKMLLPYSNVLQRMDSILKVTKEDIAKRLKVSEDSIQISNPKQLTPDSSYITFGIKNETLQLWDSLSTPKEYLSWKLTWAEALNQGNKKILVPADNTGSQLEIEIDGQYYNHGQNLYWVDEVGMLENSIEEVPTGGPAVDIAQHVKANENNVLQFRIKQNLDFAADSYLEFNKFLKSVATLVSSLLGSSLNSFLIKDIQEDTLNSVIFQFIIYPTDKALENLALLWKEKVDSQDPLIVQALPAFDFEFSPLLVEVKGDSEDTNTTSAPIDNIKEDSKNGTTGVVVGSICGAIAGVALLGAGGYYVKKKMSNNSSSPKDEDDVDPGEDSDGELDSPVRNTNENTP